MGCDGMETKAVLGGTCDCFAGLRGDFLVSCQEKGTSVYRRRYWQRRNFREVRGMADILYLKIDRNVQAKGSPVHLRDIAGLYCSAKQIENKVRTLRLPDPRLSGDRAGMCSVCLM